MVVRRLGDRQRETVARFDRLSAFPREHPRRVGRR